MHDAVLGAIEKIHGSGLMCCIAVTGAGIPALGWLSAVAGCSKTLLEGSAPYSVSALRRYLGAPPVKAVSATTSRAMALVAYRRAVELRADPAVEVVGIGSTGSIATDRDRRGPDEFFCTAWGAQTARTYHCRFQRERHHRTRQEEDEIVCGGVVTALADAAGVPFALPFPLGPDEPVLVSEFPTFKQWFAKDGTSHLLHGPVPDLGPDVIPVAIPGSFNPVHAGHLAMAEAAVAYFAARGLTARVFFELTTLNADKGLISDEELARRALQFRGKYDLIATRVPKTVDKAKLLPGHVFVQGYDTAVRLLDTKYTQGSMPALLAELRTILEAGCSVLVAGRAVGDRYLTAADLPPPEGLTAGEWADLFADLTTFQRVDLSSSLLRQTAPQP